MPARLILGLAKADRLNIMAAMISRPNPGRLFVFCVLCLLAAVSPAAAQSVERLGDFQAWSAFRFTENGNRACYMASQPVKHEGKYTRRGDIYALVTHRPAEKLRDEVSFIIGYKFKPESNLEVAIGSEKFSLFTKEDGAWTHSSDDDQRLVQSMIKGQTMVVKGVSWRGTNTTDTYSLSGFTKAYQRISATCAVN